MTKIRHYLSRIGLSLLSRYHGSVQIYSFRRKWIIPLRGPTALSLVQKTQRMTTWKSAVFRLFPLAAGDCFIDVGASFGQTLLEFRSGSDGMYYGVDPNPEVVSYTNALIQSNGLEEARVFCFAAAERMGPAFLFIDKHDVGQTGGSLGHNRSPEKTRAVGVTTMPLDELLPMIRPALVKLVKIDVEGAELRVLKGMFNIISRDRPAVLCEVLYPDPQEDHQKVVFRNEQIIELLNSLEYDVYHIIKNSEHDEKPKIRRIDAFPAGTYCTTNSNECDYLFLPRSERAHFEQSDKYA